MLLKKFGSLFFVFSVCWFMPPIGSCARRREREREGGSRTRPTTHSCKLFPLHEKIYIYIYIYILSLSIRLRTTLGLVLLTGACTPSNLASWIVN
jgi:hypothetical protein